MFPQSKTEGKDNKKQKAKKESEEDEDSGEEDTDEEEEGDEDESDEEESDEDESDDDDDEDEEDESDEEDEIAASLVAKKKVGTVVLQSHLNTNKKAIKAYHYFCPPPPPPPTPNYSLSCCREWYFACSCLIQNASNIFPFSLLKGGKAEQKKPMTNVSTLLLRGKESTHCIAMRSYL